MTDPHAKAWAAAIVAVLVVIENQFGLALGPITSNDISDFLVVIGAALVWLLPGPPPRNGGLRR